MFEIGLLLVAGLGLIVAGILFLFSPEWKEFFRGGKKTKLTRYRALRHMGMGWFSASVIAFGNYIRNYPENEIHFMHIVIKFNPHLTKEEIE